MRFGNRSQEGGGARPRGPRHGLRLAIAVALLTTVATGGEVWATGGASKPASGQPYSSPPGPPSGVWVQPTRATSPLVIRESAYTLALDRQTGILAVATARTRYSFPLVALIGRSQLPPGAQFGAVTKGSELTLYTFSATGSLLERARLTAQADYFTVSFEARLRPMDIEM